MRTIDELKDERSALVDDHRKLTALCAANGREEPSQRRQLDSLQTQIEKVEGRIAEAAKENGKIIRSIHGTYNADLQQTQRSQAYATDSAFDDAARQCSFFRMIALGAGIPGVDVGREREISQEAAKRAGRNFQGIACPWQMFDRRATRNREQRQDPMTTTLPLGGPGGNWIGTDHLPQEFVPGLYGRLELQRLGSRLITGLVGNVDIPKLLASAEATWFAENTAITLSDATAAKLDGTPKLLGSRSEFSRPMILQAQPEVEQIAANDFLNLHRRAIDRAAIASSTVNGPTGILGSGLDTSTPMAPATWEGVLTLVEKVQNADAEGNAFLTTPSGVRELRSTPKVAGTDSVMIMQSPDELAGFPAGSTTLCAPNTLLFGMFPDLLILVWESFDLLVNPYESTAYSKGNVQVRMISAVDVVVRHSESFAASVDLGTT